MLSSENQSEEQNEWGTGRERKFQVPEVQYRHRVLAGQRCQLITDECLTLSL